MTADYRQAESRARAALDHNPKDVWPVHPLAHVYEMEGSQRDGVDFLTTSAGHWSGSYFAVHNWWHLALYHLELGEIHEALALYDTTIRARRSTEWLRRPTGWPPSGPAWTCSRRSGRSRRAVRTGPSTC
jgi:hypothetical protein